MYFVDGGIVTYHVPPAGFDALNATDEELESYNLPARPATVSSGLTDWQRMMTNITFVTPPATIFEVPARSATSSTDSSGTVHYNWSGYDATSASSTAYYKVYGRYNEPSSNPTQACTNNAEVTWVGLGGIGSNSLAQDGTALHSPGIADHQAWSEVLPDEPALLPQPLYAHAGDSFTAEVSHASGQFNFYMYSDYSLSAISYSVTSSHYDGSHADFIAERPTIGSPPNQYIAPLRDFYYLDFTTSLTKGTACTARILTRTLTR